MGQYIIRRLLLSGISLLLVICIVFVAVRLMPGDIVDQFFQDTGAVEGQADAFREQLGLNDPVYVQFIRYVTNVLRGDFGQSLWTGESIRELMIERLPVTMELGLLTLLFGLALGVPLGVLSAVMQGSWLDYVLRSLAIGGISIPYFWIAILTVAVPAYYFRWSPPVGYVSFFDDPVANVQHLLVPSLVLAVFLAGSIMRLLRATMLEVLRLDYMRTAAAKGLSVSLQIRRHAIRNALLPVITLVGLRFIFLLSGSVVVESIYGLPGLGQLTLDALSRRDYQVVQAVTVFLAFVIVGVNLLVDLSYGLIDPRVRISK